MATGSGGLRVGAGRLAAVAFVIALAWPCELAAQLGGLLPGEQAPIPPAPIPNVPAPPAPTSIGPAPGANLTAPGGGVASPPSPAAPVSPPAASAAPMVPPGQIALAVGARFGRDPPAITGGLLWRVYSEKADQNGAFKLVREDRTASPVFLLPPGGYIVHVTFGLANAVKRVQLRSDTVREVFEIAAGGVRFEGKVGDARIPLGQIHFDLYKGSQFEPGEKRPVAENVASGDVVLLPEGTYHVVSNYGDGNSVMRSDLRVQPGKLVDTTIVHRAAKITLKLVGEKGGEALANTAWSVLTPGGDVIKESIGAFPIVVLAEGDYVVIARNEGKVYNRDFKVEAGVDREIDVVAR
ncbi:MAG: hypothetical protein ACJ8FV_23200 [Xanthobacteraceae bacterium]|jgi:hypothetical protein